MGSQAQDDATRQNAANVAATNAQNLQLFNLSRGAGGSAILPMYAAGQEKSLFQNADQTYNMIAGNPAQQLAQYQAAQAAMSGAVSQGNDSLNNVFNGNLLQTQLQQAQPVMDARTALAKSQQQAIGTSLQAQLNSINAQEAARGYQGTGSFARNRLLQGTIGAQQQAAGAIGTANLANAEQKQGLQYGNQNLQLSMLNAPIQRTQALIQQAQAPGQALGQNLQTAQGALNFFKINPQAFQNQNLPYVQPIAGPGQLAAGAISQTGGSVLNAYLQSQGRLFGGAGWGAPASGNYAGAANASANAGAAYAGI